MKTRRLIPVPRGCGPRAFMLLLGAAMLCAAAMAAQPGNAVSRSSQPMPAASSGGVRPAACASCHKEIVKEFAENPHRNPAPVVGGNGMDCASCHGQGEAHARSGDVTAIFDFAKASAREVNAKCQTCHGGKHANFELTAHGRGNVSCLSCHSIHAPGASKHLLKMKQPQLCYQCHSDIKP